MNVKLAANSLMKAGDSVVNGLVELDMQSDGNLVVYQMTVGSTAKKAIWASNTNGNPGAYARMQDDGNLVVYSTSGRALWASGTNGNAGAYLQLSSQGVLEVDTSSGKSLWSSGPTPAAASASSTPVTNTLADSVLLKANSDGALVYDKTYYHTQGDSGYFRTYIADYSSEHNTTNKPRIETLYLPESSHPNHEVQKYSDSREYYLGSGQNIFIKLDGVDYLKHISDTNMSITIHSGGVGSLIDASGLSPNSIWNQSHTSNYFHNKQITAYVSGGESAVLGVDKIIYSGQNELLIARDFSHYVSVDGNQARKITQISSAESIYSEKLGVTFHRSGLVENNRPIENNSFLLTWAQAQAESGHMGKINEITVRRDIGLARNDGTTAFAGSKDFFGNALTDSNFLSGIPQGEFYAGYCDTVIFKGADGSCLTLQTFTGTSGKCYVGAAVFSKDGVTTLNGGFDMSLNLYEVKQKITYQSPEIANSGVSLTVFCELKDSNAKVPLGASMVTAVQEFCGISKSFGVTGTLDSNSGDISLGAYLKYEDFKFGLGVKVNALDAYKFLYGSSAEGPYDLAHDQDTINSLNSQLLGDNLQRYKAKHPGQALDDVNNTELNQLKQSAALGMYSEGMNKLSGTIYGYSAGDSFVVNSKDMKVIMATGLKGGILFASSDYDLSNASGFSVLSGLDLYGKDNTIDGLHLTGNVYKNIIFDGSGSDTLDANKGKDDILVSRSGANDTLIGSRDGFTEYVVSIDKGNSHHVSIESRHDGQSSGSMVYINGTALSGDNTEFYAEISGSDLNLYGSTQINGQWESGITFKNAVTKQNGHYQWASDIDYVVNTSTGYAQSLKTMVAFCDSSLDHGYFMDANFHNYFEDGFLIKDLDSKTTVDHEYLNTLISNPQSLTPSTVAKDTITVDVNTVGDWVYSMDQTGKPSSYFQPYEATLNNLNDANSIIHGRPFYTLNLTDGINFDMSKYNLAGSQIQQIDMGTGPKGNNLTISQRNVLDASQNNHRSWLLIDGDNHDNLFLNNADWINSGYEAHHTNRGDLSADTHIYTVFTNAYNPVLKIIVDASINIQLF